MYNKFLRSRLLMWPPPLLLLSAAVACSVSSAGDGTPSNSKNPGSKDSGDSGTGGRAGTMGAASLAGAGNESEPVDVFEDDDEILSGSLDLGAGGASSSTCLKFMSWGDMGEFGAVPGERDRDAIVAWMNSESTATGQHLPLKPEITEEFLNDVDMVILQDLSSWDLNADDLDAFELWVRNGGAVLALSGFRADGAEVPPTNSLLSFTGMNYAGQSGHGDTSTSLGECSYCLGSTHRQEGWNAEHALAEGIESVGAYRGRSIQGDGAIVAKEDGKILGMTKELDQGRVFFFHDDWVSYRSQWDGSMMDLCEINTECSGVSARSSYQIPQFWRNAFRWLVPDATCFEIAAID